jgi:hypothetical protein
MDTNAKISMLFLGQKIRFGLMIEDEQLAAFRVGLKS